MGRKYEDSYEDDYERDLLQEQYDIDYPPMPDWMETEMEYRSRPEGY